MTTMLKETLETKEVLIRQLRENHAIADKISVQINALNPYSFVSYARGSSDHAATYLNYLISLELKRLAMAMPLSLVSVHKTNVDLSKTVGIAISQSGKSPDLISSVIYTNSQKSLTIAIVNDMSSPLADEANLVYPLHAGKETSVAATKSFIASLYASATLVAQISDNFEFKQSLISAPNNLPLETNNHWPILIKMLLNCEKMMIVGRGLGFSVASEAALKLKETCYIQAEAFSSAEMKHGPQAIVAKDYPLIVFALRGVEQESLIETGLNMRKRGVNVCIISDKIISDQDCTYTPSSHIYLDPLNLIYSFYLMVQELAVKKGIDPDNPRFLSKVTLTT